MDVEVEAVLEVESVVGVSPSAVLLLAPVPLQLLLAVHPGLLWPSTTVL